MLMPHSLDAGFVHHIREGQCLQDLNAAGHTAALPTRNILMCPRNTEGKVSKFIMKVSTSLPAATRRKAESRQPSQLQ